MTPLCSESLAVPDAHDIDDLPHRGLRSGTGLEWKPRVLERTGTVPQVLRKPGAGRYRAHFQIACFTNACQQARMVAGRKPATHTTGRLSGMQFRRGEGAVHAVLHRSIDGE